MQAQPPPQQPLIPWRRRLVVIFIGILYFLPCCLGTFVAYAVKHGEEQVALCHAHSLYSATELYCAEMRTERVLVSSLVGPLSHIKILEPVAGASYPTHLRLGEPVVIRLADARRVLWPTPPRPVPGSAPTLAAPALWHDTRHP